MEDEVDASPEPLDDDWIARFFRISEDVSTPEMQALWGRILAGEVLRPRSYSLRTLDILKNIGKDDAAVFQRFAELRISVQGGASFVINPDMGKYLLSLGVTVADILHMREYGLLDVNDHLSMRFTTGPQKPTVFQLGDTAVLLESSSGNVERTLGRLIRFTIAGQQLAELVPPAPSAEYVQKFAEVLKHKELTVSTATITERQGHGLLLMNKRILHSPSAT